MRFVAKPYRMADIILEKYGREHSELITTLEDLSPEVHEITRPLMTQLFKDLFLLRRWDSSIDVFEDSDVSSGKIAYMKGRVGVQVSFNHYLRIGTELLRFQTLSYADQNLIDVGVFISISKSLVKKWGKGFLGSITFEQATAYYERFRGVLTVPILFIGILPTE